MSVSMLDAIMNVSRVATRRSLHLHLFVSLTELRHSSPNLRRTFLSYFHTRIYLCVNYRTALQGPFLSSSAAYLADRRTLAINVHHQFAMLNSPRPRTMTCLQ